MYKLSVKTQISGAHSLRKYEGDCSRLHGHNWKIIIEVRCEQLDEIGMGIDFGRLTEISENISNRFDHRNINEIPPFDEINPTAENLARYFYTEAGKQLPQGVNIAAVRLWETDDYMVEYCG